MPQIRQDITRERLLRRIAGADVRIVVLLAAAGYGKTTLALQYARTFAASAVCDFAGVESARDAAERGATAMAQAARGGAPAVIIFENAEDLCDVPAAQDQLAALLENLSPGMRACVCTRVPLSVPYLRFAYPHEIAVLDEAMLAFDSSELERYAHAVGLNPSELAHLTRGWPLCVRLIGGLAEAGASDVLRTLDTIEFASLYDYLAEHVIERMSPRLRDVALLLAATGGATDDDIQRAFPEHSHEALEDARHSAFVLRQNNRWMLHPLIAASIEQHFPAETKRMLRLCADVAAVDDPVRAAILYGRFGDWAAAADAVAELSLAFVEERADPDFEAFLARVPREIVLERPALFASTAMYNAFRGSASQRLEDALHVHAALRPDESPAVRAAVLSVLVIALSDLGRHEEALAYLRSLDAAKDRLSHVYHELLSAVLAARVGNTSLAMLSWPRVQELVQRVPATLAFAAVEIAVRHARTRCDTIEARRWLAYAIANARRARNAAVHILVLSDALFGAWLRSDDETFGALAGELRGLNVRSVFPDLHLLPASIEGDGDAPGADASTPLMQAQALLLACRFSHGEPPHALVRRAIAAADACAQPWIQSLARMCAAGLEPARRSVLLQEAATYAASLSSGAFAQVICAMQNGDVPPFFVPFFSHFTTGSNGHSGEVSLFDGLVRKNGVEVHPTARERELLMYLAFRSRAVTMNEIAEDYAPNASSEDAARLVRVTVTRIRKKFGPEIIASGNSGYALGAATYNPWREMLERIRRCERAEPAPTDVLQLRRDLRSIESALSGRRPNYEWGAALDASMEDAAGSIRLILSTTQAPQSVASDAESLTAPAEDAPNPETDRLRILARVRAASKTWNEHACDADYLLRGRQLAQAIRVREETAWIPPDVAAFIDASHREAGVRRAAQRRAALVAGIASLAAVALGLVLVGASYAKFSQVQRLELAQRIAALQSEMQAEGFDRIAQRCARERALCMRAEEDWLSNNVPLLSTITLPHMTYNYGVGRFTARSCTLTFEKRYVDRRTGRTLLRDIESGSYTGVDSIFSDLRGFDGGDLGIFGDRMPYRVPTAIVHVDVPFTRIANGSRSTYAYIYFSASQDAMAGAIARHLRLYALLCGGGRKIRFR